MDQKWTAKSTKDRELRNNLGFRFFVAGGCAGRLRVAAERAERSAGLLAPPAFARRMTLRADYSDPLPHEV